MKKKLLALLFSLTSLALVSCGGGNDGASTGTPVVAQATVFDPTANGGCLNSSSYGGSGPALTQAQQAACTNAISNATTNPECNALGGNWQDQSECNYSAYANGGCANSSSFGGSGPALTQAQQHACGEALTYASNTSECSQLGGNYVNQRGSAGGSWSYCDGGAAGLKGRGFSIN